MTLPTDDHHADQPEATEAERVAAYLLGHPDFLEAHPEVFAALEVPHDDGGMVSLVHRQIATLRGQVDKYRSQLEDLIAVARENDALAARLHRLMLALMEATSRDDVLNTLREQLREQFQADAVELKLFPSQSVKQQAEQGDAGPALFEDFIAKRRPSCGELAPGQLNFLFGERAGDTASVALIPLDAGAEEGLLAIGSTDPDRFHPGQAMDFLSRLGEVVSHSLRAVIRD